jgi:hypothetical protein
MFFAIFGFFLKIYQNMGQKLGSNNWKVFFVDRKVFPLTGKCFLLTRKCFPLTNFPNGKQTQESLESGFPETEFRETNMA